MSGLIKLSKWLIVIIVLGAGGYFGKGYLARSEQTVPSGKIGIVTIGDIVQRVTVSGTVSPLRQTEIKPAYDGYVKKLFVKVGDRVKTGDPLITVVESLSVNTEDVFPIRAPMNGEIVEIKAAEGQNVVKNASADDNYMIRIEDLTERYVMVDMPELEYAKVDIGHKATIRASAILGKTFNGTIVEKALAAKPQARWSQKKVEFPVKIRIDNPDAHLRSGMSVIIDIITAEKKKTLTLRHEFVGKDKGGFFVTTESGVRIPIKVGLQDDMATEITEGLKEGDRVKLIDFLAI
jgi:multidrug efflux pump subunit AcrA (membrane-fusion protein)